MTSSPKSASGASTASGTSKASSASILVADDDPEILSLVSRRLEKRGYRVYEAADGLQTLAEAREKLPDLIILDVMMPGKNGWEVAKELRSHAETKDIGILVLTAIGETMNAMTAPLYDADDFLDKPFEFAELEARIAKVLAKRGK
jgi:DNA-binding response OmpR family regulator